MTTHATKNVVGIALRLLMTVVLAVLLVPAGAITGFVPPLPAYADESAEQQIDVKEMISNGINTDVGVEMISDEDGEVPDSVATGGGLAPDDLKPTTVTMAIKHTMIDAALCDGTETIDKLWADMAAGINFDKFIGITISDVDIYDPGRDSDKLVAFMLPSYVNGLVDDLPMEAVFAVHDTSGTVLDEIEYDLSTGVCYIPKATMLRDDVLKHGIEVQLLEPVSVEKQTNQVELAIDNNRSDVTATAKVSHPEVSAYDVSVQVPIADAGSDNIDVSDLAVRVNGMEGVVPDDCLSYDAATGILEVGVAGSAVSTIDVEIASDGLFSAPKAYAVTGSGMRFLQDQWGNESVYNSLDPEALSIGQSFTYTGLISYLSLRVGDSDDWSPIYEALYKPASSSTIGNSSAGYNWIHSGGVSGDEEWIDDWSGITPDKFDPGYYVYDNADVQLHVDLPTGTFGDADFSDNEGLPRLWGDCEKCGNYFFGYNVPLYCAHVSTMGQVDDQTHHDARGPIQARVMAKGDDYVVLGLTSAQSHTQSGYGAYKIKCNPFFELNINKQSTHPNTTTGNACYTLAGAVYGVYTDPGCTQVALLKDGTPCPNLVTDANGYASTNGMNLSRKLTYYVKELTAPVGFLKDEQVHVLNGKDASPHHTMDLYDVPKDDPVGIMVYKGSDEQVRNLDSGGPSVKDIAGASTRLAGAEFQLTYYDGYYASEDELNEAIEAGTATPKAQGVWTSDAEGAVNMYGPPTRMNIGAVNGDWPYKHTVTANDLAYGDFKGYQVGQDVNTWPLGTVTIQEVKAPVGYELTETAQKLFGTRILDLSNFAGIGNGWVWGAGFDDWADNWPTYNSDGNIQAFVPNKPTNTDLAHMSGQGSHVIVDEPYRSDITFTKRAEDTQKPLPHVPFALISKKTGEYHIVVTDNNGYFDSSSKFNKHTENTNANDAAVQGLVLTRDTDGDYTLNTEDAVIDPSKLDEYAGVWFYGQQDDSTFVGSYNIDMDARGALPYDDYRLIELRVVKDGIVDNGGTWEWDIEAGAGINAGYVMSAVNSIELPRQGYSLDIGTIDNQPPTGPAIQTEARDAVDGDHYVNADAASDVIDRVSYLSLVPGRNYVIKTWLVYQDADGDGEPDDAEVAVPVYTDENGDPVYKYTTFNAQERPNGEIDVVLEGIDTRDIAGKKVVFFEECYEATAEGEGQNMVADHKNTGDYNQMLEIVGPEVGTTLTDGKSGDKTVSADGAARLVDTVEYRNLVPGHEYTATGTLMVKADGGEAFPLTDVDGNEVTASTTFTPKDENGTVEVVFEFDASLLGGKELVAYETLSRVTVEGGEPEDIAKHEDPEDEGQTVTVEPMAFDTDIVANGAWEDEKAVVADSEASVTDTIHYAAAVPGDEYTAYGILFDPSTGLPVLQYAPQSADKDAYATVGKDRLVRFTRELFDAAGISSVDGRYEPTQGEFTAFPVTQREGALEALFANRQYTDIISRLVMAETTWTADGKAGDIGIDYRFDARFLLCDKAVSMVVVKSGTTGAFVAGGLDLTDERETVTFVTPEIGTTAVDGTDGDKYVLNGQDAVVVDTVEYKGLVAGKEYVVRGTLMDKATGEPLYVNDEKVTAEQYFVPAASEGTVDVTFTFDASNLPDSYLVVFEQLYRDMNTGDDNAEDVKVAVHEDIDDEGQTVVVTGDAPKLPTTGSTYGKTGLETAAPWLAAGLVLFAAAGVAYAVALRRNRRFQAVFDEAEPPSED